MAEGKPTLQTFADLLRDEWLQIRDEFLGIIEVSVIEHVEWPTGFIGFWNWRWRVDEPPVVQRRHDLLVRYERWLARFRMLFSASIPSVESKINEADELMRGWVARDHSNDWSIPTTIEEALSKASEGTKAFSDLIEQVAPAPSSAILAIVDTNCLLRNPDLASYGQIFPGRRVQLVLPPVVIRELDELKDRGRSPDVRDAALKAIRRIKGLRDRGSLLDGVVIEGTTTARLEAIEPDFARVPSWLDGSTPDDRLLASALTLQAANAAMAVVIVTADLNLATKAEFSRLPTVDPTDSEP